VNTSTIYPTTYKVEYFYPPYFSASTRPQPTGVPKTLSYGGDPFNITVSSNSYSGSANDAAANSTVVLHRGGFTTHAMNMGQRHLQLNNTYTVNNDGSITLHVAQVPPNPSILTPGPALLFVVINGIPSNGTIVIVGNGQIGKQPTGTASVLPSSVQLSSASGTAGGNNSSNSTSGASHTGVIIGAIAGAVAVIGILGALFGICLARRRRAANDQPRSTAYQMSGTAAVGVTTGAMGPRDLRNSDSSAFMPLQDNSSMAWNPNASTSNLNAPYKDEYGVRHSQASSGMEFDPYSGSRVHSPVVSSPTVQATWDGPRYEGPRYEGPRY